MRSISGSWVRQSQIARADAGETDRAVAELQLDLAVEMAARGKQAAAFFRFLGTAPVRGIEHHAVAGLQRSDLVRCGWVLRSRDPAPTRVTRADFTPRCRGARPSTTAW